MTRDEHIAWCKKRALEYLDRGELGDALASMCSDLSKHDETMAIGEKMAPLGLLHVMNFDGRELRRWIEGFR